jgi:hypothetical protein
MREKIKPQISTIICDNTECDYKDDNVKVKDYKKWLNRPCPKCSQNLLTQYDYNNLLLITGCIKMLNALSDKEYEARFGPIIKNDKHVSIKFNTHNGVSIKSITRLD